jgi:hypothetical protein
MTAERPSSWFSRLAARIIPVASAGADRQLRLYLALVFILFVPTAAIFAWADWQRGDKGVAVLVAAISVMLATSIQFLRRSKDIRWGYRFILTGVVLMMTGVVFQGGGGGYAVLWFYVFPGAFYYVFGAREGSVWVLVSLALPATILFTSLGAAYPSDLARRFVVIYALVSALALGLQRARDTLYGELAREKGRLEKALNEVRTLTEMIPMCAWCRKVRDDKGYWSLIEEYLARNAGSVVSHGLCPDCARKLADEGEPDRPAPVLDRPDEDRP